MKSLKLLLILCLLSAFANAATTKHINIVVPVKANARVLFGAERLEKALTKAGYDAIIVHQNTVPNGWSIVVGLTSDPLVVKATSAWHLPMKKIAASKEGFSITSSKQNNIVISGMDNSGALYGCLELADELKAKCSLPQNINMTDHPEMVLRGACIGMQKSTYLPRPYSLRVPLHS